MATNEAAVLKLTARTKVEFDGMIRIDAALTPGQRGALDRLALEIPLRPSLARYLFASQADDPAPQLYVPQRQSPWFFSTVVVRTHGASMAAVQTAMRRVMGILVDEVR